MMPSFPHVPVSPREFIEEVIPALFAELELDAHAERIEFKVGLALEGETRDDEGGEWTLHFIEGELGIAVGLAEDCTVTILQSTADWRAGLWEGRPRLVADAVDRLKAGLTGGLLTGETSAERPDPAALRELEKIAGRIDAIIEGEDEADWQIGIRVGPGPIPEAADATIRIGSEQAEALRRGDLHPVEALITGQLRLEGDLGLILQLQAIAMATSFPRPDHD
jgi:hypothetical protein